MIVDCDRCEVRGEACGDCVITVLLGSPPGGVELDCAERRALENLAAAGLVPGLQLIPSDRPHRAPGAGHGRGPRDRAGRSDGDAERSGRWVG